MRADWLRGFRGVSNFEVPGKRSILLQPIDVIGCTVLWCCGQAFFQ
jgi:hypothetical protein